MKKIVIFFLTAIISITVSGCVVIYQTGAKVYDATATTEKGKNFVRQYNAKYLSKRFGLFYADIIRWDDKFAIDVKEKSGKIEYRKIKEDAVEELGLVPSFTWWQRNGKWTFPGIFAVIIMFGTFVWPRVRSTIRNIVDLILESM